MLSKRKEYFEIPSSYALFLFPFASPNRTYPNYFAHIEWFGFAFYIH